MRRNNGMSTLAKAILLFGIVGIHIALPVIGVITIPVGLLAGLYLFWQN